METATPTGGFVMVKSILASPEIWHRNANLGLFERPDHDRKYVAKVASRSFRTRSPQARDSSMKDNGPGGFGLRNRTRTWIGD